MKASHILTFLGGAFLGAIVALLLAPEKGEITRRKIKEKLEEKGIRLSSEELDKFITKIKNELGLKKDEDLLVDEDDTETEPQND